jgi:hypothetical protein
LARLLLYYVSTLTDFGRFYPVLLIYTLCFMPTLALTNSLSFHQMRSPRRSFPASRARHDRLDRRRPDHRLASGRSSAFQFQLAAGASALLGVYSLFLPAHAAAEAGASRRGSATSSASTRCS